MRKVVLVTTGFLILTGLLLTYRSTSGFLPQGDKWMSILHIWGGVLFLVVFPLYSWDHVSSHRVFLRFIRMITLSGGFQLAAGVVILLTGLVLLMYGNGAWQSLRDIHHWLTYPLAASLVLHFLAPKN
ncbi:MAG: hypothetical protein OEW12_06410 [Deltaproteobacteria bacterium]|nr:hypothetical protein [Deltaproteobacteria bacterium]